MIYINTSCQDELCRSAAVLRGTKDDSDQVDEYIVLLQGDSLHVFREDEAENWDAESLDCIECKPFFKTDAIGSIFDMQVLVTLSSAMTLCI